MASTASGQDVDGCRSVMDVADLALWHEGLLLEVVGVGTGSGEPSMHGATSERRPERSD
jgi:hypothetical protein